MVKLGPLVVGKKVFEDLAYDPVDSPYFFKGDLSVYAPRGSMHGSPYEYTRTPVRETAARYYGIVRCQWCGCNMPDTLAVCSRCTGPRGMRI